MLCLPISTSLGRTEPNPELYLRHKNWPKRLHHCPSVCFSPINSLSGLSIPLPLSSSAGKSRLKRCLVLLRREWCVWRANSLSLSLSLAALSPVALSSDPYRSCFLPNRQTERDRQTSGEQQSITGMKTPIILLYPRSLLPQDHSQSKQKPSQLSSKANSDKANIRSLIKTAGVGGSYLATEAKTNIGDFFSLFKV